MKPLRRVARAPGTPYGRLALAGLLGLAAAAATIGLLAGSGYVVGRAALHPGLGALVGILAAVEVLAFLRGPLRYAERLIGHDAALRTLAHWRVWLYDCLTPRVPAALVGWRSGDLLSRAIDDVDTLQDLYLRTMLPLGVAAGAATLGLVVVGLSLPLAALALGIPLLVACTVPPALVWHAAADEEDTALAGEISAYVVDIIHGAPELLAFGGDAAALDRVDEMSREAEALARRRNRAAALASFTTQLCLGAALTAVLAVAVSAVHSHHLNPVMVAVLPLAALGTFEPVPGITLAASRALAVRAAARRLLALEAVPIPVSDPVVARSLPEGVPDLSFAQASLRYAPELPRALDEVTVRVAPGRAAGRHRFEWSGQVQSGQRAVALLALGERRPPAGRRPERRVDPVRRTVGLRTGRPAGADVRRHPAVQRHPGTTRRQRRRDRNRPRRGAAQCLGGRPPGWLGDTGR